MATMRDDTPARRIGHYVLLDAFASGGMATIHFGRAADGDAASRVVAIKRLHPHLSHEPEFVAMFVDEARMAMRIKHPNVARVLDVFATEDELLMVMEYIPGSSLARFIPKRREPAAPMPVAIAAAIFDDALRGLHAAHEAKDAAGRILGIVHRDVSPQNILVGADGVARVIDFGVAKAAGRLQVTRDGMIKGKIAYMAPEQLTAKAVTQRADIYAAAVVLWECLAGRRLLPADQEAAIEQVILGDFDPPSRFAPDVPGEVDDVVMRGLARDPAKRWESAEAMADALTAATARAPASDVAAWMRGRADADLSKLAERVRTIETTPIARLAPRPGRRRRTAMLVAFALVATAFVGTGFGWIVARGAATPASGAPSGDLAASAHLPEPPSTAETPTPPPSSAVAATEPQSPPPSPSPSPSPSNAPARVRKPARRVAPSSSAPPSATARDCAIPWVIDAQGHKRYDPACLK